MTRENGVPTTNRSAVLLAIVGAIGILASISQELQVGPVLFAMVLLYVVLPIVLIIAAIPLGVGSRQLRSVVGPSILGRVLFIAWAVFTAASQLAFLGELGQSPEVLLQVETVRQVVSLAAMASGIVAGVIILNSGPRTLARGAMFLGVFLYALSEGLFFAQTPAVGAWWGVPLALGQLLIGISFICSGLPDAASVPETPESLAE